MAVILVADDEASIRTIINKTLSRAGHEVVEAANGEEAVARLSTGRFDLAIIDVVMPKKGGIETLMEVHLELRDLKVLVISGKIDTSSDAFRNLATHFGASRILKKPFSGEELLAEVKSLLAAPA